ADRRRISILYFCVSTIALYRMSYAIKRLLAREEITTHFLAEEYVIKGNRFSSSDGFPARIHSATRVVNLISELQIQSPEKEKTGNRVLGAKPMLPGTPLRRPPREFSPCRGRCPRDKS